MFKGTIMLESGQRKKSFFISHIWFIEWKSISELTQEFRRIFSRKPITIGVALTSSTCWWAIATTVILIIIIHLEFDFKCFQRGSPFQRDQGIRRGQHSHVQVHFWNHGSWSPRYATGLFSQSISYQSDLTWLPIKKCKQFDWNGELYMGRCINWQILSCNTIRFKLQ